MSRSTSNYWINLTKLLRDDRLLRPIAATYYVTSRCNLNCAYCQDFGAWRNGQGDTSLSLEDATRVLGVIRSGTDRLTLTGGEPLLYPGIDELVEQARGRLKFRHLTLLTNGLLLPEHERILPSIDRLIISLDSIDADLWGSIVRVGAEAVQAILSHVRAYAARQGDYGYQMAVHCVVSPETLPGARQVLDFCAEQGMLFSFSPQATNNWPRYELLVSEEYRAWLVEVMARKRRGEPILGSQAYLHTLLDLRPYSCYPALVPRIMPSGELVYPCWPIEKAKDSHGGRPCNLLEVSSWSEAMGIAAETYGPPPRVCHSCFQQCYAEPSLMQARPLAWAGEWLRYRASRRGGLASYAPG